MTGYGDTAIRRYGDAENKLWQYGYDDHHQILTVTDPVNAVIVDNVYDASGKVIRQTDPRDNNTTAVYTLHYTGLSSSEEDPLGHRATYYNDFAGRTVAVENALGEKNAVDYDGQGQVIKQTDPLGRISSHSYDSHNNLRVSWNPLDGANGVKSFFLQKPPNLLQSDANLVRFKIKRLYQNQLLENTFSAL